MIDPLRHRIQRYAWGSRHAIPELLGIPPDGGPMAELWLGGHPLAPSQLHRGAPRSLAEVIADDPLGELGADALRRFGAHLPFLLKVLAADAPLSLQVHPSADQALAGFAAEDARGVPRDAPQRNYRDPHHKPELICAVTPFEVLSGFRPVPQAVELLALVARRGAAGLARFAAELAGSAAPGGTPDPALRAVVTAILTMPADIRERTVKEVGAACAGGLPEPFTAVGRVVRDLAERYPGDPGVVVALLLNHVLLAPGEALFVGPGQPHAYVHGCGVEVMAGSDNVLRCGLTPKHIDVAELLRVTRFTAGHEQVLRPEPVGDDVPVGEWVYPAPAEEFRLSRLDPGARGPEGLRLVGGRPQIVLCLAGHASLTEETGDAPLPLDRGGAVFIPANTGDVVIAGVGTFFRVTTGG